MDEQLRRAIAQIIHTGDVSMAFRNAYPDGGNIASSALQAHASGEYSGLTLAEIEQRLADNYSAAD